MTKRRSILKGMASIFPLSMLGRTTEAAVEDESPPSRDYFKELGVTPFINAAGAYSAYGGARMRPEVVQAMRTPPLIKSK